MTQIGILENGDNFLRLAKKRYLSSFGVLQSLGHIFGSFEEI